MDAFVDLYVTDRTLDLGADGLRAIDEMLARGRTLGLVPAGPPAEVVGGPGRS